MRRTSISRTLIVVASAVLFVAGLHGQGAPAPGARAAAVDQAVPKNLKPLLQARQSEMRLVTVRYTLDRTTLAGNFFGAGRGGGGRGAGGGGGAGGAAVQPEPLSPGRIARLARFDLDWQAALAALDPATLSPAAKTELETLTGTVQSNLKQAEIASLALAEIAPLVPFAPSIVGLVEARIRIEDIDPQKAAGTLTAVTADIGRVRSRLEAGLAGRPSGDALRVAKDVAARGPAAVDALRAGLNEWFTFYNGHDPLFTWWMGLPFKKVDAALQGYATFLREKVVPADGSSPTASPVSRGSIAPGPAPKYPSVPDLKELIALPQDEMIDIVQRFRGQGSAGGRGGRGGGAAAGTGVGGGQGAPPAGTRGQATPVAAAAPAALAGPVRDRKFHEDWLKALKTLDFDKLSRNAQVDYLYIKKMAELQIARVGIALPENPPRKTDSSGIPGPARGRQGLIFDLQDDLVPYTPEELIAIGEEEFAWCEAEMKKASRQLGLGDDWKAALEKVKGMTPPPGGQARAVRDLMFEAVDYLRASDLLNVPAVAAESLHMIMMTPERQLVNPFFTGGSEISVSYPTDTMEYDARLQSMRGNNTPFSHATAFHEVIPGHNLVGYMSARHRGYRPSLGGSSPFYGEGWPLYWEITMYDIGFHDTPEKKIGALFWRMHRCARIIFSLKFHMGQWSPQECVDFLVDRVGFERDNAMGEVRRSFQGGYGPLYQAAYLLGGMQIRALRKELVDSGAMGQKAFHDEVLRQGSMPIALLRLAVGRQKLTRDTSVDWKFYGQKTESRIQNSESRRLRGKTVPEP
jgi:hypothetical protein